MLPVGPIFFEGVLRNREIDDGDEDTNRNFRPEGPPLVIVRQPDDVKAEPSDEAICKQLKMFLSVHN